jgi:hypothetical protein
MIAVRLSTAVDPEGPPDALEAAERRIRDAWARLAPELEGYASTRAGTATRLDPDVKARMDGDDRSSG